MEKKLSDKSRTIAPDRVTRILLTRPTGQNQIWKEYFQDQGAQVIVSPAISILPLSDFHRLDELTDWIVSTGGWICFFSTNGAKHFFQRAQERGVKARELQNCKFGAVGQGTRRFVESYIFNSDRESGNHDRIEVQFVPSIENSAEFARQFSSKTKGTRSPLLLIAADRGKTEAKRILSEHGFQIEQVAAYRHVDTTQLSADAKVALDTTEIDWVIVTSSAAAANLQRLLGPKLSLFKIVTISQVTADKVQQLGLRCAAVASQPTVEGVWESILKADKSI